MHKVVAGIMGMRDIGPKMGGGCSPRLAVLRAEWVKQQQNGKPTEITV